MSEIPAVLRDGQGLAAGRMSRAQAATPAWRIVLARELNDLWVGGKALYLILIFTLLLGILTWVLATNQELSLIPPREMAFETVKQILAAAAFIGLILGADSLSGERERGTLEALLLTPASRRQIVAGKFLAALSPWVAIMLISTPYLAVLASDTAILMPTLFWGAITGCLLIPAYTAMGMLISFWSSSNKNSFLVGLALYVVAFLPTQWAGNVQKGFAGQFVKWVDPLESVYQFLAKILVNNRTFAEFWIWLEASVVFFVLMIGVLFLYAAPGLRLDPGRGPIAWWSRSRTAAAATATAALLLALGAAPVLAQETPTPVIAEATLRVDIDMEHVEVNAGDPVRYTTVVTNLSSEPSPSIVMAMNVINLDAEGDVVDPEDWSPQRTQYIETIAPGESVTLSWLVNAILHGDYLVYMVAVPEPRGKESTSVPVASSGIHLTVNRFTRLNPGGVLPYAVGGPLLVGVAVFLVYRMRRRGIDLGGEGD